MWDRKELKSNAKALIKPNYWKVVVASLVLLLCFGTLGAGSRANTNSEDNQILLQNLESMDQEMIVATLIAGAVVLIISVVISILISLFIKNPFEVGARRLFVNCKYDKAEFSDVLFSFKNSYLNIGKTVFLRDLFVGLWSLLLVVPGIVKAYEYMMVPYILAENPGTSSKEAFAMSKEMMTGHKWNAFVLDLSFLGWHILGALTFGIVEIFYAAPYHFLTSAELYHTLKK